MHDDCTEKDAIRQLEANSKAVDAKVDLILENQKVLATDLKQTLDRLTSIIEEDIGTRKDVEQGKKDIERLYLKARKTEERTDAIEIRNAKCDGLGVFGKWDEVWNFVQQEKSLRRFWPTVATVGSFIVLLYVTFGD